VDGSVAQALEYDEFGRVLSDTNPGFQPFGFAGGLHDPATGLVRFGFRDYDPQTAQWTARDPILFAGGQTSLYAYVGNNPVNTVDPLGTGPFHRPKTWYTQRFSRHQRKILGEADTKIARNRVQAHFEYQRKAQLKRFREQIRRHTKLVEEDLDFLQHVAKETAEEVTGVFERTGTGKLDMASDLAEAGSEHAHVIIEELTGEGLSKAERAAKQNPDLRGPGAKQKPFNPLDPSTY
jgi:RHS repeat-associated protein